MIDYSSVLQKNYPTVECVISGNDYETLQWFSDTPKPTKEELDAAVTALQAEYDDNEYQRKRAAEYPDFKDYLDGVVKGDQAQIQAYIDACQAVKDKYPKGV